jgi:hypothetical protein
MTTPEVIASAVSLGYWLTKGDWSIGKRIDGLVMVVAYPTSGRVEFAYKPAEMMGAVEKFMAATGGQTAGL